MKNLFTVTTFFVACLIVSAAVADTTTAGFDGGNDDGFTGNALFEAAGGNPGGNAHFDPGGALFFPEIRTGGENEPVNPAFVGDFSSFAQITFGFDIRVDSIRDFIGNPIARPFGVMLIDRDIQGPSGPSGVFFETPFLSEDIQDDWTHYSVTIDDPMSAILPNGWIGFGDEDPNTFDPILPNGATFATVLAGVDEFRLTGGVPGFFFTDAFFDVRIDNVSVTTTNVPEPTSASLLLMAGLLGATRRRHRS